MKRGFKRAIGIIVSLTLVNSLVLPLRAGAAASTKTAYLNSRDETTQISCVEVQGVPVPYVAVDEYYNIVYEVKCSCEKFGNDTYKFDNGKGIMIIDASQDTIHFDKPELFMFPVDSSEAEEIVRYAEIKYKGTPVKSDLDLDLKNYDIDIIVEGNKVYMPLTSLSDLFSVSAKTAVYAKGEISFNDSGTSPVVDWQTNFDSLTRDESEVQFTYNELCFVLDTVYGCPPNCEFADSIKSKGLDGFLSSENDETRTVKELLLSTKTSDYIMGLFLLEWMLNDGGHTTFMSLTLEDIQNTESYKAFRDHERNDLTDPAVIIFHEWYQKYTDYVYSHTAIEKFEHLLDQYTPIIDEKDSGNYYRYYEYDNTGIYVYTEYSDDAIIYLKKALDIAKEHRIKNFIFDEAKNGGGSADDLIYMMNTITGCNYNELNLRSVLTDNKMIEVFDCDMDQDGVHEGDDEDFDYDFNYAIICSKDSFSCGNLFPCLSKEEGIPVIGETSAGGTDSRNNFKSTLGGTYSLSSYKEFIYKHGGDVEAGATPDYDITKKNPDGTIDYTDFYNFGLLSKIANEHYKTAAMYRLYNPNSGEHFYTANASEKDDLVGLGWSYEGSAWTAPKTSDAAVYRLYSSSTGDHHYTTDAAERAWLIGLGWNDEGIGWYSFNDSGAPLYRLYNPNATGAGSHHYTTDIAERDFLVGQGWNDEGIGWYGE